MTQIELVAWDFGDMLVDRLPLRIPPPRVPEWTEAINSLCDLDDSAERWERGHPGVRELRSGAGRRPSPNAAFR